MPDNVKLTDLYNQMKQDGLSDQDIYHILKMKFNDKWDKAAQQIGMPVWTITDVMPHEQIDTTGTESTSLNDIASGNYNMDTQTTMTQPEMAVSETIKNSNSPVMEVDNIDPVVKDNKIDYKIEKQTLSDKYNAFATGDAATFAGLAKTGLDILNFIGIDTPKANKYIDFAIKEFNKELKEYDKKNPGFNLGDAGRLAPTLSTLPLSYGSKVAIAADTAISSYGYSRGEGNDKLHAGIDATQNVLAGFLLAGMLNKIFSKHPLSEKKAIKLNKWLIDNFNLDEKEISESYKNWYKVMGKSPNSEADKAKAILQYLGDEGKALYYKAIERGGIKTAKGIIKEGTEREKTIYDLSKVNNLDDYLMQLNKSIKQIKNNYSKVVNNIGKLKANKIQNISYPDALDFVTHSGNKILKEKLLKPNPTVEDLIEAYQTSGKLSRKVSDKSKKLMYDKIKQQINSELQKILPENDYIKWKEVNEDYSKIAQILDNKAMDKLDDYLSGKINKELFMDLLAKDKTLQSSDFMNSVRNIGGKDTSEAIEKSIVNHFLGGKRDLEAWDKTYKKLKNNQFVTEEGKKLKEILDTLSKEFKVDNALKQVLPHNTSMSTGWSDNLLSKVKYRLIQNLYEDMIKYMPTETGKYLRKIDDISKLLQYTNKVDMNNILVKTLNEKDIAKDIIKVYFSNKENKFNTYKKFQGDKWLKLRKAIKDNKFDGVIKILKRKGKNILDIIKPNDSMRKGSIYIGGNKSNDNLIEFRYKLDDEISKLNDNQKYNAKQLKNYLINKGVSPKEIETSNLFNGNITFTGKEWKNLITTSDNKIFNTNALDKPYEDIKLNNTNNYQVELDFIKDNGKSWVGHFKNQLYNQKDNTILGWRRYSELDLGNGKKATVLNELQSDWLTEARKNPKDLKAPIKPDKYYQYAIVKGLNKTLQDGNNIMIIPISRMDNELVGSYGVEKFYDENVKNFLNTISKKLKKFGIGLKYQKVNIAHYTDKKAKEMLYNLKNIKTVEDFKDLLLDDTQLNKLGIPEGKIDEFIDIAEFESIDKAKSALIKYVNKPKYAWAIKIKTDKPKNKVIWYIYILLGALGLSQFEKGENNEQMETK